MIDPERFAPPDGLAGAGPAPELAVRVQIFGQFIGRWDITVTNFGPEFSQDTSNSFHWRSVWSTDNWKSSHLEREFSARRHGTMS